MPIGQSAKSNSEVGYLSSVGRASVRVEAGEVCWDQIIKSLNFILWVMQSQGRVYILDRSFGGCVKDRMEEYQSGSKETW